MQYSPKLKKAMEEVKAILKKHDIAGSVILHTPGYAEFLLEVTPSYSCAKIVQDGIRFKAKKDDFNDAKLWSKTISDTYNMVHCLASTTAQNAMMFINLEEQWEVAIGKENIEFKEGGFTSSSTQSN